tara:strand:+ start:1293 stop:1709 length:417 start_codon:yes stop_codon:yes gene_type:complete
MEQQFASLKAKISFEQAARMQRREEYAKIWEQAWQAGHIAGETCKPRAMHVSDMQGNLIEVVNDGACGFAWLTVRGANKGFGHWLIKQGLAKVGYTGGAQVWISNYNQSYERKAAHAYAMARVLEANGIKAYSDGRLD